MSKIKIGLAVLGFYLVFLIFLAPAAFWLKWLPLPAGVVYGPVTGTLWQGKFQAISVQGLTIADLHWQLKPLALLTGKIALDVSAGQATQVQQLSLKARVEFGASGAEAEQVRLGLPIAQLQPLLNLPLPVGLSGRLHINLPKAQWSQGRCKELQGLVSWQDAKAQPPTGWLSLGTLDGQLSCLDGQVQLVTAPTPPLHLEVNATFNGTGGYQLTGFVKPDSSMPQEVHQAMRFVGRPDAQGRFPIKLGRQ